MGYNAFVNSTFLDAYGAGEYTPVQYQTLTAATFQTSISSTQLIAAEAVLSDLFQYGPNAASTTVTSNAQVTVGLILDRATDASSLLSGNWAQRHAALDQFADSAALWSTYGANAGTYTNTLNQVLGVVGTEAYTAASSAGYISSAADRTIWLTLNTSQFTDLFGAAPLKITSGPPNGTSTTFAWAGNLGLNDAITTGAIKGLWVERSASLTNPAVLSNTNYSVNPGPLGIGNDSPGKVSATPAAVAASYSFPLPTGVATDAVALVETTYGNTTVLANNVSAYRQAVGLSPGSLQFVSGANLGGSVSGELTLDISVLAGAVPNSNILLYSDLNSGQGGTPFNAYQQIFFDTANHPAVLSSSYPIVGQATAGSPFQWAFQQLFVDGALANVTVHMAGGDEGASAAIPNGIANVANTHSSPYTLLVGGTSIANLAAALSDPTLNGASPAVQNLVQLALQNDPATVFSMVAGGLKVLPTHLAASTPGPVGAATQLTVMFETVWQALTATNGVNHGVSTIQIDYGGHETGSGGIATLTDTPGYQRAFGLSHAGRSMPDVSALSSGDAFYTTLNANYVGLGGTSPDLLNGNGGTSAASPLWASLTTQFNTIFHDQGLPKLGYYNDLLYIADVIAPGAFNDIQLGNNINSFYTTANPTGYYNTNLDLFMVPTGHGYSAQPGFDLASGLGTPNGLLLARALSAIAHQQVSFGTSPPLLSDDGHGGWVAGTSEALLIQTFSPDGDATVGFHVGNGTTTVSSGATANFAWTARLAQQSLQSDFDPSLVLLFDKQAQGSVGYTKVAANQSIGVTIDGLTGHTVQATMSNPFGFADFLAGGDAVHVARPVALAETVGGANNELAVVRMRQGGENSLQLTFYKVDDFNGAIEGLAPGHADYAAAMQGRAYQTTNGLTGITGPGYGQFSEVLLKGVNAGDIVAMRLDNLTTGAFFWAFANANEKVNGQPAVHLVNYGLNTWGWEDTYGLGDKDYNDMTVQIDFTSAHGHGWLI